MAIDSAQKRMSAMNLASPWRGPMVDATEAGFTQGNRQAADFMYSGILAGEALAFGGEGENRIRIGVPVLNSSGGTVGIGPQ